MIDAVTKNPSLLELQIDISGVNTNIKQEVVALLLAEDLAVTRDPAVKDKLTITWGKK